MKVHGGLLYFSLFFLKMNTLSPSSIHQQVQHIRQQVQHIHQQVQHV